MNCHHCNGAGWVLSQRPDAMVDLCRPCRGNGVPDAPPAPPRRLGLRERVSYALVGWLGGRRAARP